MGIVIQYSTRSNSALCESASFSCPPRDAQPRSMSQFVCWIVGIPLCSVVHATALHPAATRPTARPSSPVWLTQVFGYYIMGSYVASLGLCFAAPGANVAGYTKRVTSGGMIFVAYATGNIIGPHLFHSDEVPPYRSGMLASIVCFVLVIPMVLGLRVYYVWENARRDRAQAASLQVSLGEGVSRCNEGGGGGGVVGEALESSGDFADWTDCENPSFRYAL